MFDRRPFQRFYYGPSCAITSRPTTLLGQRSENIWKESAIHGGVFSPQNQMHVLVLGCDPNFEGTSSRIVGNPMGR